MSNIIDFPAPDREITAADYASLPDDARLLLTKGQIEAHEKAVIEMITTAAATFVAGKEAAAFQRGVVHQQKQQQLVVNTIILVAVIITAVLAATGGLR